ncbi:Disease resistance protein [Spatholobus suberectus]|nr:Disease resistance protein [Spatholobus suberectus]
MGSLIVGCHQFLTSPRLKAWLKAQWIHLKSYETRVRELKGVVEKLKEKKYAIQRTVDEEEHRHGREIHVEVKEWIKSANLIIDEYEVFDEDKLCHEVAVFDLFDSGYLPKPGIRYRRSRKAYDITRKANGLLQTAKFDYFSYWSGPPYMAAFFSNVGYESFPSREETMRKIIEELEKPSVGMIGLHGLSGVGKTTLVKEVVKDALEEKMFDVVTMASVTKNPDIRKIQGQIVDMLGVVLDSESDIARAARIQKILKNEKKSTLIILDDLWEKLDLNMVGIPYEIDNDDGLKNVKEGKSLDSGGLKNVKEGKSLDAGSLKNAGSFKKAGSFKNVKEGKPPTAHSMTKLQKLAGGSDSVKAEETHSLYKGCKILMISESRQVLLSQMEGKANSIYPMEVLKEKEAEMLFKKMAGIGDQNSEFEKLAAQIANKCKGLPMSIVTTARALKHKSPSVWEDIHRKLAWQNLSGAPEFSTKLSYDLLEDEELKYTFLLCARMVHDALIMDLVKYCIGLGFLQGIYTVRETRDRVYALVATLKESGLLSEGYSSDHFTMQDTVRSAALSIAYKENHLFTMTKGKIDEWPDKLERYAAISLYHCDFIDGFLKKRNYQRLRVFQVNNNNPNLKIPHNFFKGMKELRVLILTGIHLSPLKLSISSLTELRMLCLEQCMLDKHLSIIGKLKKLRILSFSGSDIENLPVELKQLEKLQIFDISNCSKLKEIPSGVISSLVSLEELYMRNTLIQWEVEECTHECKKASLSELKHLNQLTTLDIQIPDISYLPKNLFFDHLYSYKIVIGDLTAYLESDFKMPEKYETLRFLAISNLKAGFDIHSLKGIKMLFERVENLFLEELNTVHKEDNIVHDIFYRLNLKGFPYLKNLLIVNDSTVQSLIHPEDRQHPEKVFPKLESLYLYNLKKIDNICSCELSEPSFGKLKVIKINLCSQLKNVFLISVVRLLTVLETIEVSECNSLEEIVPVERQSNTNEIKLLMFPKLRCLKLRSLSKFIGFYSSIEEKAKELFHEKVEVSKLERMELSSIQIKTIWSDQPLLGSCFKNLTHLDVNDCWELKHLISFSMAKSLVSLQSLFVSECEKMRSIFPLEQDSHQKIKGSIFPKLKNIKLSNMKSLSEIWNSKLPSDSFSKLDTLIIEDCDKLVNAFSCYTGGIFRSLCNLRVTNCRSMQAIFNMLEQVGDVDKLQDVHLETLPELEHVWKLNEDKGRILKLKNLQKIWVQRCDSLKNIFPFSVAKCLRNLEYLVVWDCSVLREIVAKGEAPNTDTAKLDFKFPELSTIKFSDLPRLTSFYRGPGAYDLSCPKLNDLSIELCGSLEPFNKKEPVLFPEKVINKLKSMQIESLHVKSPSSYMREGNHRRDNLEELCLSRLMDTEVLYSFLHRNPNLKSLSLNKCFFEEIVPREKLTKIEKLGVVPKLKSLKLIDLPKLKR